MLATCWWHLFLSPLLSCFWQPTCHQHGDWESIMVRGWCILQHNICKASAKLACWDRCFQMSPDVIMGKSLHCSCCWHVSWHVAVMSAYWQLTCQLGGLANTTRCQKFQLSCCSMIVTDQQLGQLEWQQMTQRTTLWRSCDDPYDHWWRSCDSPSDNFKTTLTTQQMTGDYVVTILLMNWWWPLQICWWHMMTFDDPHWQC